MWGLLRAHRRVHTTSTPRHTILRTHLTKRWVNTPINMSTAALNARWETPSEVTVIPGGPAIPSATEIYYLSNLYQPIAQNCEMVASSPSPLIGLFAKQDTTVFRTGVLAEIQKKTWKEVQPQSAANGNEVVYLVYPFRRIEAMNAETVDGILRAQVREFGARVTPEDPEYPKVAITNTLLVEEFKSFATTIMILEPERDYASKYTLPEDINIIPYLCVKVIMQTFNNDFEGILQEMLQIPGLYNQQIHAIAFLKKTRVSMKHQSEIYRRYRRKKEEVQKKVVSNEMLQVMYQMIGKDESSRFIDKFNTKLQTLNVPDNVKSVIAEELERLKYIKSFELHTVKTYLEQICSLPWGITSLESYNVQEALKILDEDHYGLDDVKVSCLCFGGYGLMILKNQVLEAIATMSIKGQMIGKIWCLVGPPGTGKTSFAKSIARALGRKYVRVSVGGLNLTTELKGHRRTYVGAMPGKIIQSLKQVGTQNPVVLIDEIDKMGTGDAQATMLEILDPEQNSAFVDDYLDVPFDLSKVFFILTANDVSHLSAPLLDRLEIININGYLTEEKREIFDRFLVPQAMKEHGLNQNHLTFDPTIADLIVHNYCREPGVRNLQKQVEKICRKVALKIQSSQGPSPDPLQITKLNIAHFLGPPKYKAGNYYDHPPPGVVMGLGANESGGSGLFVETVTEPVSSGSSPALQVTGQLGAVMKESAEIAYTFAKNFLRAVDPGNEFFKGSALHMNWLHGATPKEGPSGAVTIVTSLLSIALNTPVPADITMTGEVTLNGKVLCIGGVRSKTVAGIRAGAKRFIFHQSTRTGKRRWLE